MRPREVTSFVQNGNRSIGTRYTDGPAGCYGPFVEAKIDHNWLILSNGPFERKVMLDVMALSELIKELQKLNRKQKAKNK